MDTIADKLNVSFGDPTMDRLLRDPLEDDAGLLALFDFGNEYVLPGGDWTAGPARNIRIGGGDLTLNGAATFSRDGDAGTGIVSATDYNWAQLAHGEFGSAVEVVFIDWAQISTLGTQTRFFGAPAGIANRQWFAIGTAGPTLYSTLRLFSGDGPDVTNASVSGLDLRGINQFAAHVTASQVRYYCNGAPVATRTVTKPGTTPALRIGNRVEGSGTGATGPMTSAHYRAVVKTLDLGEADADAFVARDWNLTRARFGV